MSSTQLAEKIVKDLYDRIEKKDSIYDLCFAGEGLSNYYYKRRMVREQIKKYFKILSLKEIVMNSVIVVYFIYNNKYCRLAITDSSNHAKYLTDAKYEI